MGSIKGGSAIKHKIYFNRKDGEWRFPKKFSTVEEAWEALRKDLVELVDAYDEPGSPALSEGNSLIHADMVIGKILYLYHRGRFLPIYKREHLHQALKTLGVSEQKYRDLDYIESNRLLKRVIAELDPFNQ